MDSRPAYKVTYTRSRPTRTDSLVSISFKDEAETTYHPHKKMGEGTYGYVRAFKSGNNFVAVKAPKIEYTSGLSDKEVEEQKTNITKEFDLLKQAYPNEQPYALFDKSSGKKDNRHYEYRMIMPFLKGQRLKEFVEANIKRTADLAILFMRCAEELQRIHDIGVIHGDVSEFNIMVEEANGDFSVHYIDFGLGYKTTDYAVTGFETQGYLPKERVKDKRLKAHPSQDVYSFADLLERIVKSQGDNWANVFYAKYPAVEKYIYYGRLNNPDYRPSLQRFIYRINYDLYWKEGKWEDEAFIEREGSWEEYELCMALKNNDTNKAIGLKESKAKFFTGAKLIHLLHRVAEKGQLVIADGILSIKKRIPITQEINGTTLFHLYAKQPHLTLDDLEALLNYHNKCAPDVLNRQDSIGNTMLHYVAEAGNIEVFYFLLEQNPDLLIKNKLGQTVSDIATNAIKPLVDLCVHTSTLAKRTQNPRFFEQKHTKTTVEELRNAKLIFNAVRNKTDFGEVHKLLEGDYLSPKLQSICQGLIKNGFLPEPSGNVLSYFKNLLF